MSIPRNQHNIQFALNIPRYFVYTALKGFGFGLIGAMWVIFLTQHRGLSLAQASLVDVMFFVAAAFGEVPTGIVADRFGRKTSLLAGAALLSVGILGWTFAPHCLSLWCLISVWALALLFYPEQRMLYSMNRCNLPAAPTTIPA